MTALRDHWTKLLGHYEVHSGDEKLDRMVNIWNPYQCMVTFNMSRSASYFETGIGRGMGFRDSNQDLLGLRPFGAGAGARADHRHRLDAVRRRERLSPVPAAHQARKQRRRQRLQRRSALADLRRRRLHQGDRRLRHLEGAGPVRQRREEQRDAVRAPQAVVPPCAQQLGAARPAAHRARRLERLPEPQLLLRDAGRVVPDHGQSHRSDGGVGLHRRHVRRRGARLRLSRRSISARRPRRRAPRPSRRRCPRSC